MSKSACTASITHLLNGWAHGDDEALERLAPQIYPDLRRMARRHMRAEADGHLLQSTGLVHEAFMRLAEERSMQWTSRGQFFGWMSMLMRRILVEHARSRQSAKRGGGIAEHSLEALQDSEDNDLHPDRESSGDWMALLQLHQALERLEALDPRQGRVVELRFFGGLNVLQTAETLDISVATVKREWSTARAWLVREFGSA